MGEVNCLFCGGKFQRKTSENYCSDKCRIKARTKTFSKLPKKHPKKHQINSGYKPRKKYYHQRYLEQKKKTLEYGKKYRDEQRRKLLRLIGNKCLACGRKKNINFHEIFGKLHLPRYLYYFKHKEDFVSLCGSCHEAIHKYAIIKSKETEKLLNFLCES